ncbi:nicotinate-nucleotide adenylyltransferase [Haloferula helveola]|uniref:Probable nicotinate-nucleotide adenylyltransferase n=1 Tax=Haloferula helveola TaxID=490095 RepID=A0ABM7RF53_9BACT|nr:nicotinate-nucleotide adenylyltransferase [Haloferula helveola]
MKQPKKIALFGGSFDPVHLGHLEIARLAVEQAELDRVIFIPCRLSPHKQELTPPASGKDRLEMLRIATDGLPWATVDDFELRSPPPSYSYLTLREMKERFPGVLLHWLMGKDQWDALPTWKESRELAETLTFLVFSRDGAPEPRAGWKMIPLKGTHPASATTIRRELPKGGDSAKWLPHGVLDYILKNGLYPR